MKPSGRPSTWAAFMVAAVIGGCATTSGGEQIAALRIARREGPGVRWADERERPAAPPDMGPDRLAQALRFCTKREPTKFLPRYRVTLVARSGRETDFLVLGRLVKVHGISYRCDEDVEGIAARRWSGP